MKKAFVVLSSPHAAGHTAKLLNSFLSGLDPTVWEIETLNVCEKAIHPCTACGACKVIDGCVHHDLDGFDASFRACDLFVVASPVYNLSFPAQFKALLDRFQRYFEARFTRGVRPVMKKPRRAVLLLTMGKNDDFAVEVCEKTLRQSFSILNVKLTDTLCLADTDQNVPENASVFEKARRKAIEITSEL